MINEVRKLLREPALTAMEPWQQGKLGITAKQALELTRNLDKIWDTLPRSEVKRIVRLLVQNVVVKDHSDIKLELQHDLPYKILEEVSKHR